MSAVAEPVADALTGDRLARRNALVLAITQALAGGNNTVLVATAAIVGTMLAPDKGLATLPISIFVLGMWMGTLPMGVLARRFGRRNALQIGTVCGVLTGLICCVAVLQGSFLLFNIGAVFSGLYASGHQSYRFGRRHRERRVSGEGNFLGSGGRHFRRRGRSAARDRDAESMAAIPLRRDLYRAVRARADRGSRADVCEHTQAAAALGRG